jgi:hypothetical protein
MLDTVGIDTSDPRGIEAVVGPNTRLPPRQEMAGQPRSCRAMASREADTCSPVESSISISRLSGWLLI